MKCSQVVTNTFQAVFVLFFLTIIDSQQDEIHVRDDQKELFLLREIQ